MKQIKVLKENCIGCGACVAIDSEHFAFNEDGKSSVISNENLESGNLVNAIESCPTCAISMVEEESCTNLENNGNVKELSCENGCECNNQECTSKECDCEESKCSKQHADEENSEI